MIAGKYTLVQWVHHAEAVNLAVVLFGEGERLGFLITDRRDRVQAFTGLWAGWVDYVSGWCAEATEESVTRATERPYSTIRPRPLHPVLVQDNPEAALRMLAEVFLSAC